MMLMLMKMMMLIGNIGSQLQPSPATPLTRFLEFLQNNWPGVIRLAGNRLNFCGKLAQNQIDIKQVKETGGS